MASAVTLDIAGGSVIVGQGGTKVTVELNHTIIAARDKQQSAAFLAGILGLEVGPPVARFASLALSNSVTLDYVDLAHWPSVESPSVNRPSYRDIMPSWSLTMSSTPHSTE
ncbi:MAG TPA: hypothetical protein VMF65_07385 [Acidimicrobiales bacterium]|nr:hypothetical protein [Acidimicrobiales bacterium]